MTVTRNLNIYFCVMLGSILSLFVYVGYAQADAGGGITCSDGSVVSSGQSCPDLSSYDSIENMSNRTGLPKGSGSNPILNILIAVIKFVAGLVGGIAVFMIIVAGIMYITSAGDSTKTETAKNIIVYAIIGLVVALLAWIIVDVVISNIK